MNTRMRQLKLRMLDDSIKTVMVDDNQPVANLMVIICTKLGITNSDEYSLIATTARRKDKSDRVLDQKMEQLKKKIKTDEDLPWLDHSKTLGEQGINEEDSVILKRKFFYSDQNVDLRDPIQLDILYAQIKEEIIKGIHPVSIDGACKFAGIQLQAQYGDSVGHFNLKDFLPFDYSKIKQIDKKILSHHKKYYGLGHLEAKLVYINEARSLPTYGATFFLVKEKVSGKNKLVPRLLGITKDCVMRVDADTKTILKTWPLTTVKRWAASLNSFTLDFGDYSDSYYSLQTSEGEQISQLIAGYIDMILKRKKQKDHFGLEGDEGCTMVEHEVAPSRAIIIQHQPGLRPPSRQPSLANLGPNTPPSVMKTLREEGPYIDPPEYKPATEIKGKAEIGFEKSPPTQYLQSYNLSDPQEGLHRKIEKAQAGVDAAQRALDRPAETSNISAVEFENKKQKLANQFASLNAATAQLVSLSTLPEEGLDYPALNKAVDTVTNNLPDMAKDIKIVASLMEDEESGEQLIDATRHLCKAFSDLLNAAEPGPVVPRQSLISAASRVGDATQALLYTINEGEQDRESADILLSLAKGVANAAAALVLKAKDVASNCQDQDLQNLVIGSATQCALATSQMVTTAKIVAPTIDSHNCQKQLLDACNEVYRAVDGIKRTTKGNVDDAAYRVDRTLDKLIKHSRFIERRQEDRTTRYEDRNTRHEERTTKHEQMSLHNTAPSPLAESTISGIIGDLETTIIFAVAGTLKSQDDDTFSYHREHILSTAKALVEDTKTLVANAATDQQQLSHAAQDAVITITRLSKTVKAGAASLGPTNVENQVALIRAVKDVAISLSELIGATKSALGRDVNDPSMMQVKDSAKVMVSNVTSLLRTVKTVEDEHQRGIRALEATIEAIEQELHNYDNLGVDSRQKRASPEDMVRVSKPITLATAKTVAAGSSGKQDDVIVAANMGRKAIFDMLQTTKSASTQADNPDLRNRILQSGKDCAIHYRQLLGLLHRTIQHPSLATANPEIKQDLINMSRTIATCVTEIVNCSHLLKGSDWVDPDDPSVIAETELLGAASSIDAAARKLENLKPRITSVKLPHEDLNFDEMILEAAKCIIEATAALLRAASASQRELLVDGRLDETEKYYASDNNQWSEGLVSAARMVAAATHSLVEAANALVQGQASEERLISAAKQVASSTNQLLVACKVKADPESKTMMRLQNAGNAVKRATDNLVIAAQQAIEHDEEQSLIISNRKVSGIAQEISAREQILRKEKELQVAKTQLMAIRKAKYSNRPDDYQGYGGDL